MPYCFVEGNPIVLTHEQYEQLFAEAGKDKGWEWRIGARIIISDRCQAHDAVFDLLRAYYLADPTSFMEKWVYFDFEADTAAGMLADVLDAYSGWYGHCTVQSKSWTNAELMAFQDAEVAPERIGRVIQVWHTVRPKHWWWRVHPGMMDRQLMLNIEINRVKRVAGTVMNFFIE